MWSKVTTSVRDTSAGTGFVVGLSWKHAPVAGSLLAAFTVISGATTPLVVWSVTGLIDALSETVAAQAELWPPIVPWLLRSVIGVAGLVSLYVRAHWLLAIVLVTTVALRAIVAAAMSRRLVAVSYRNSPRRREMGYWAGLLSSRAAAPELRLFGLASQLLARWRRALERAVGEEMTALRKVVLTSLGSVAVQQVIGLVMVIVLLLLAMRQSISLGELVALLYGLSRFRELVGEVDSGLHNLFFYRVQLGHLRAFLALEAERRPYYSPRRGPRRPLREGAQFHDVSFTYPGAARPAVAGVRLALRPQERVALVGENGAGKTTLVRLLLGLYRPTQGAITVDGIDLAEIDPDEWRREATAVFQDFVRYPTTVRENISYGDVAVLADGTTATEAVQQRVAEAAARSGADRFIETLPDGYEALLGKEWAGGVELSSGQWQRLAIARAYMRDAQIIVLDEPTAALDPRAEVAVYRQFSRAAAGRCAVLISHRLGAARLADRIVVLADGCLVEEGSHDALLERGGAYAGMYRLQACWYAQPTQEAGER